jgi:hypothetical protein
MPSNTRNIRRSDKVEDNRKRQREGHERLAERDEDDIPQETYRDGSVYEEPPLPKRRATRRRKG